MGVSDWLFSFQGRIGRLSALAVLPIGFAGFWGAEHLFRVASAASNEYIVLTILSLGAIPLFLVVWMRCAVAVKRAHDRGYSGWINIIPFATMSITVLIAGFLSG
jgi:uncharacterized membrane protein YhaH (DUF805 family)